MPRIIPPQVPDSEFPIVKSHVFFSQIVHPVQVLWKAVQPPDASFTLSSFVRLRSQLRVHCVLFSRSVMKMLHQYRVLGCIASDWPTGELCATGHNTLCPADQPLFSFVPGSQWQDAQEWLKIAPGEVQAWNGKTFLYPYYLYSFSLFWGWSNSVTGFQERWVRPQACQCSQGAWTMHLITCFNLAWHELFKLLDKEIIVGASQLK